MEISRRTCPPLNWRVLAWLTASPQSVSPEASGELRAGLFNRMISVFVSAAAALMIEGVAVSHHPTLPFYAWIIADGGVLLWSRLGLALAIVRYRKKHPNAACPPSVVSDGFLLSGLLWSLTLGLGAGAGLAAGDAGLSVACALLTMGTAGAQCGRLPGAPRLAQLHIALVVLPFGAGGLMSPDHLIRWMVLLVPIYLIALGSINRQLHVDYVELILSRLENRGMALRCALTSLANRRMFDQTLEAALKADPIKGLELFLLCLDLDGFKAVNDRLGHAAGDTLLRQVASRILRHVPIDGLAARIGGDEFAVLMTAQSPASAEAAAGGIVASIREPFYIENDAVRVGISIGIARAADVARRPDRLLSEADRALYAAKRAGKNTFRWHDTLVTHDVACLPVAAVR